MVPEQAVLPLGQEKQVNAAWWALCTNSAVTDEDACNPSTQRARQLRNAECIRDRAGRARRSHTAAHPAFPPGPPASPRAAAGSRPFPTGSWILAPAQGGPPAFHQKRGVRTPGRARISPSPGPHVLDGKTPVAPLLITPYTLGVLPGVPGLVSATPSAGTSLSGVVSKVTPASALVLLPPPSGEPLPWEQPMESLRVKGSETSATAPQHLWRGRASR